MCERQRIRILCKSYNLRSISIVDSNFTFPTSCFNAAHWVTIDGEDSLLLWLRMYRQIFVMTGGLKNENEIEIVNCCSILKYLYITIVITS